MLTPVHITREFAVTAALERADVARAAQLGFGTIVSLLPDGERPDALSSAQAAAAAHEAGLAFAHLPTTAFELFTDQTVNAMRRILEQAQAPILATCASGQRAAIAWAAASARTTPVDNVLASLSTSGFDLGFLRDDLEAQAHRGAWQVPQGLDQAGLRRTPAAA